MAKTAEEKAADKAAKDAAKAAEKEAAEKAEADRRAALTQEERDAEDAAKSGGKPPKAKATDPIVVKYRDFEGKPTERTFSLDVHGEGFAALAEEFKVTNASKLITE